MSDLKPFLCHCSDSSRIHDWYRKEIREDVCRGLPFYGELNGKQYCVLHYPSKEKAAEFETEFNKRMSEGRWNFRLVYFPIKLRFEKREFSAEADFSTATFAESVEFKDCKFLKRIEFFDSRFLDWTEFTYSEFFDVTNFNAAEFSDYVSFAFVHFHSEWKAFFEGAKFQSSSFHGTTFHGEAVLTRCQFLDHTSFLQAEFLKKANFQRVVFPKRKETSFHFAQFHESVDFEAAELFDTDFSYAKFASDAESSKTANSLFWKASFKKSKFKDGVTFNDATFQAEADFTETSFHSVAFTRCTFARGANFSGTNFVSDAYFHEAKFGQKAARSIRSGHAFFNHAVFGERSRLFFDNTWFSWVTTFDYAQFGGYVMFKGGSDNMVFDSFFEKHAFQSLLSFQNATIEKPEQVYFHTVRLRPSWFVNVDSRRFNLTNVRWKDENDKTITVNGELDNLKKRPATNPQRLLRIALRQLAVNSEENNRYEDASDFRRMAMETEWIERKEKLRGWIKNLEVEADKLKRRVGGSSEREDQPIPPTNTFGILRRAGEPFIYWLYRTTSFYGESWSRAAVVLLIILTLSALFYTRVDFYVCPSDAAILSGTQQNLCQTRPLNFSEGLRHSLLTATLQSVDFRKPATGWAESMVLLEKIFAPLQFALLALAIRRKFMR